MLKAVTSSYDNNIWLFDEQDSKLKKIDDAGNVLFESVDFRLLFDDVPSPEKIVDKRGFVYLYDPKKGMYVFDYYGAFKNKLTFLHWKDFVVMNRNVYGYDDTNFYNYYLNTLTLRQFPLPSAIKNYSSIKVANNKMYVLQNNQLQVFTSP